jgi:hypothetical protein
MRRLWVQFPRDPPTNIMTNIFQNLIRGDWIKITYLDGSTEEVEFLGSVADALTGGAFVGDVNVSEGITITNPDALISYMGSDDSGMFLLQPEKYQSIERINR